MDYNIPPFEIDTLDDLHTFDTCHEENLLQWLARLERPKKKSSQFEKTKNNE